MDAPHAGKYHELPCLVTLRLLQGAQHRRVFRGKLEAKGFAPYTLQKAFTYYRQHSPPRMLGRLPVRRLLRPAFSRGLASAGPEGYGSGKYRGFQPPEVPAWKTHAATIVGTIAWTWLLLRCKWDGPALIVCSRHAPRRACCLCIATPLSPHTRVPTRPRWASLPVWSAPALPPQGCVPAQRLPRHVF